MATRTRERGKSGAAEAAAQAETRERVLVEAARLFRHRGYAATTLREIADAAGIKAGSIYYHFDSKEDILVEVLDLGIKAVFDGVRARVDALPAGAPFRDRLSAVIEGHLWGLLHRGDFTSANIRIYGQIPASAKKRHRVIRREYADYWDRLFETALANGQLRRDASTAVVRLFVLGALNWTVEWYNPQRGTFPEFVRQVTAMVFDGILPEGT
jgi:AcrR family transcriptional regulator